MSCTNARERDVCSGSRVDGACGKNSSDVLQHWSGCGHVSGLLMCAVVLLAPRLCVSGSKSFNTHWEETLTETEPSYLQIILYLHYVVMPSPIR